MNMTMLLLTHVKDPPSPPNTHTRTHTYSLSQTHMLPSYRYNPTLFFSQAITMPIFIGRAAAQPET